MSSFRLVKISQAFDRDRIPDVEGAVRSQLSGVGLKLRPDSSVGIAVGSRGIANLARIVAITARYVCELGGRPFIVPAMGSHGGATAEGQRQVLESYGVTERNVGCPIRSSMEVVELPAGDLEHRVFMDRNAYEADGLILINRIKPHTDFHGTYGSGLVKMCVIGLGKEKQAHEMHRFGVRGLRELVPRAAAKILSLGKILLGIGIVENAYDETVIIEAVEQNRIMTREPDLLAAARRHMPRLPVERLDVLMVDRMGKDISGTGMDTNIIGRIRIRGQREPETPDIKVIIVADITNESHGNATGMGLADVTTRRLFEKIDFAVTNRNIVTSSFLERGKLPVMAETDEDALEYALRACGPIEPGEQKIIRIRDTLHLNELYVSPAVLKEVAGRDDILMTGTPQELFDEKRNLREF